MADGSDVMADRDAADYWMGKSIAADAEVERLREALRQERCRGNAAMRYGREAARLRREKDALIRALADALHVSESEAWLIARLDVEEPEHRAVVDPPPSDVTALPPKP